MRIIKFIILFIIIFTNAFIYTGCWNYREMDQLAIVAGVAVDKGTTHSFRLTIETIEIGEGREAQSKSKLIVVEGDTMFDAARNGIEVSGKKLYWSHSKAIILSKDIAKNGAAKVLDWYNRDSETRSDTNILVSGEATAGEILEGQGTTEAIKSIELGQMIENENRLAKAPHIEIWKFINSIEASGIDPVAPLVVLKNIGGNKVPEFNGTALFSRDKLIGFLDGEETKYMLFVQNEVKSGVMTMTDNTVNGAVPVSLEIFKNKTAIKPVVNNNTLKEISVKTETEAAIDEIEGEDNFTGNESCNKFEKIAGEILKTRIENVINKVQVEFGTDIFGFGVKVHNEKPKLWNSIKETWEQRFRDLKVSVDTKVHIANSAMMARTIKTGD